MNPGFVYFNLGTSSSTSNFSSMLPATVEGPPPPSGTPVYTVVLTAPEFDDPQDALRIINFTSDFSSPSASTFTERSESPIATDSFQREPVAFRNRERGEGSSERPT